MVLEKHGIVSTPEVHMCGRFTHALTWSEIVQLYRLTLGKPPEGWAARYNLAPSQQAPVVRISPDSGQRELAMLRWGLVPFWAKEAKIGYKMINARAETVAMKPVYREGSSGGDTWSRPAASMNGVSRGWGRSSPITYAAPRAGP
jgi:hypothetical protein